MLLIKNTLTCILLAALAALAVCGALFVSRATEAIAEVRATRVALTGQVAAIRVEALQEIDKQADGLRKELHGDVRLVNAQVSGIRGQLNQRAGDVLTRVDTALKTVDARTAQALDTVAGVRGDLRPVLANSAALVKDAQDSWDDSYDDVRSLVDSAEVATTQTAQTLEAIKKATPDQLAAAQKTADSVAGITTDVHAITAAALKPKTFWGKIWAGVTVASRFAGLM